MFSYMVRTSQRWILFRLNTVLLALIIWIYLVLCFTAAIETDSSEDRQCCPVICPSSQTYGDHSHSSRSFHNGIGIIGRLEYRYRLGVANAAGVSIGSSCIYVSGDGQLLCIPPNSTNGEYLWSYSVGKMTLRLSQASLFYSKKHGVVAVVMVSDGSVHAVLGSGKLLWTIKLDPPSISTLLSRDIMRTMTSPLVGCRGNLYIVNNGKLYAIDTSGGILWINNFFLYQEDLAPVLSLDGNRIYLVASIELKRTAIVVVVIDDSSSHILYDSFKEVDGPVVNSMAISLDGSILYVGLQHGTIVALKTQSGSGATVSRNSVSWKAILQVEITSVPIVIYKDQENIRDITAMYWCRPSASRNLTNIKRNQEMTLMVTTESSRNPVIVLDASTGAIVFGEHNNRLEPLVGIPGQAVMSTANSIYFGTSKGYIYHIDISSGLIKWHVNILDGISSLVTDLKHVTGGKWRGWVMEDLSKTFKTMSAPALGADGRLFIMGYDGTSFSLFAFGVNEKCPGMISESPCNGHGKCQLSSVTVPYEEGHMPSLNLNRGICQCEQSWTTLDCMHSISGKDAIWNEFCDNISIYTPIMSGGHVSNENSSAKNSIHDNIVSYVKCILATIYIFVMVLVGLRVYRARLVSEKNDEQINYAVSQSAISGMVPLRQRRRGKSFPAPCRDLNDDDMDEEQLDEEQLLLP